MQAQGFNLTNAPKPGPSESGPERRAAEFGERLSRDRAKVQGAIQTVGRSQFALYQALAFGPYQMYRDYEMEDKQTQALIEKTVEEELQKTGAITQAKTTFLARLVKVSVLSGGSYKEASEDEQGELRRKSSVYSSVLSAADREKVDPSELARWIHDNGGVERVKSYHAKASARKSVSKSNDKVEKLFRETLTIDKVRLPAEHVRFNSYDSGKSFVLIGTYLDTGELEIKAVVRSEKAVTAAKVAFHAETSESAKGTNH
ncbi:hypothetical protein [Acidovorax sp.]|uniref:hypothetical protein n=1 Tax=Acidovorax sp. TaxID=1872122 RepID=UPI00391FB3B4